MHSVLPRCRVSLLSTSQSEQDSRTFPSLLQSGLIHYEKTGLCYYPLIREAYSLDQC